MAAVPNVSSDLPHSGATASKAISQELCNGDGPPSINARHSAEFSLRDHVIENFRPMKVIVVGAGFSGIYCAIRIPQRLRDCELVIYEKNADIGGTWFENRYVRLMPAALILMLIPFPPGVACDIPSHSYQYSFNPNSNWSAMYAPAREIHQYLKATAEKYSVGRHVRLQHEVIGCHFDQTRGKWLVKVRRPDGTEFEDTSDVLVTARGSLNHISYPKIDGLSTFKGEVMHSAEWNQSYDFVNKRIGIIGVGSSAIQIIPNLRKVPGIKLDCFIRGKTWISPPFGQKSQDDLGITSLTFSEEQKYAFRNDPELFYSFRHKIEENGNAAHPITVRGTEAQIEARKYFEHSMKERLSKRPDIYVKIRPDFAPGCRRLTPGPGFLEALQEDNVNFVDDAIAHITPTGIVTADGTLHEIDVLVCATGFKTGAAPPFPVTVGSTSLSTHWSHRATSYLSLATDGFPNMFMMLGPNSGVGSGSLTQIIEKSGDYITKCIRKLQKENIKSMSVLPARVADFIAYADAYFATTVFTDECRSWYRTGDKITGLWPGSTLHCLEALRSPRWEDYEYEYHGAKGETWGKENRMAWLGNGWSSSQVEEGGDMAWYLQPRFLDIPQTPKPEDSDLLLVRPFSH